MKMRQRKLAHRTDVARRRNRQDPHGTQLAPVGSVRAALLTGSFACALSVPVHAAGLPVPCPGSGTVCNGLRWDKLGTGSANAMNPAGTKLTINQNANSAIFNWQSFNITPGNSVAFVQPGPSSVALNRIYDPNLTSINGSLSANGQLYLINPNGILFGRNAMVDVGGLIASTQNIDDQRVTRGLLYNTNLAAPVFSADPTMPVTPGNTAAGTIAVQPGATLYAAGRDTTGTIVSAGRIFLFAPSVSNAGSLEAAGGGQVILAAGSNVYLGSSSDPTLRGLLVEVNGGVKVDNTGTILSDRGNVTMMGLAVNQAGTVAATSAINENGSIRLVAREIATAADGLVWTAIAAPNVFSNSPYRATGQVTLASGSKTIVALDPTDKGTAPLSHPNAAQMRSSIAIEAGQVEIGGQGPAGSTLIEAHGGDVTISARSDVASGAYDYGFPTYSNVLGTYQANAVVDVHPDTLIDVSGLNNVSVDGARNFVFIDRLTSNDLANAPLQKAGFLLGQPVWINLAQPPSFIDVTNRLAALAGTQAERDASGGTISLRAEGSVNVMKGATLNVSGGTVDYSSALGRTSQLIAADGSVVDITNAAADVQYVGFADQLTTTTTAPREGIDQTVTRYAPHITEIGGFAEGRSAGTVEILAPGGQMDGTLIGHTFVGPNQRNASAPGGQLRIGMVASGSPNLDSQADLSRGNILLTANPDAVRQSMSNSDQAHSFVLNPALLIAQGFSRFDLTSDGQINLAAGSPLSLRPGGQFSARGNLVTIDASITAPGGSVSLAERPLSPVLVDNNLGNEVGQRDALNLVTDPTQRGVVRLAAGTTIDTAGLWTNDALVSTSTAPTAPIVLNGGNISISGRNVDVSGSTFDVSAGALWSAAGVFSGGAGGSLSIKGSYQDPLAATADHDAGTLNLGKNFEQRVAGFGVTQGGSIAITAPGDVWIGTPPSGSASGATVIDPAIGRRGFASFSFTGFGTVGIAPGGRFAPDVLTFQPDQALASVGSASSLLSVAKPQEHLFGQPAPAARIGLGASNTFTGQVSIGKGATVDAGPIGSIALTSGHAIDVDGSLDAPGGTVSLALSNLTLDTTSSGAGQSITPQTAGSRVIDVGSDAVLDVSGVSEVTTNAQDLRTGAVLDAGSVSINAAAGYLAVETGARILAHGTKDRVDSTASGGAPQTITLASAGGNVSLQATSGLYVDGTVDAHGGGAGAPGGNLSVRLLAADVLNEPSDVTAFFGGPRTLQIDPAATALPAQGQPFDSSTFGARGRITPALVDSSGFDQVWLGSTDSIEVLNPVSLATRGALVVDARTLVGQPDSALTIQSPYVAIGSGPVVQSDPRGTGTPVPAAVSGAAVLTVKADQIDVVGASSLQGFGTVNLQSTGDVRAIGAPTSSSGSRVVGSLEFGGNLAIQAAQLYPATQTDFSFVSNAAPTDPANGRLSVSSQSGVVPLDPLSAGGSLTFQVGDFVSSGRVAAPQGSIEIDASRSVTLSAGSVTSVTGSGLVPYGTVTSGTTWSYTPSGGSGVGTNPAYWVATAAGVSVPAKGIRINAPAIGAQPGSTLQIRGGGDTVASDFVPGPGGSYDVSLNFPDPNHPTVPNALFALLPTRGASFAPYDPQIFGDLGVNSATAGSFQMGRTITIGSGSGIPAGTYAVLPARYALLPGAYALQAVAGYTDLSPGRSVNLSDGTVIVSGRLGFAAAGTSAERWSGFRVYSDAQFRRLAEFHDYLGSQFFASAADTAGQAVPRLGPDAGSLQIDATSSIQLASTMDVRASDSGRGSDVAIDAPSILVADPGAQPAAGQSPLVLDARALSNLGAETLVLGALEQRNGGTITLSSQASSVIVQSAAPLSAGEVILAGSTVDVQAGSTVAADPASKPRTTAINALGDGAALYVSNGASAPAWVRSGGSAPGTASVGDLSIGANAAIRGATVTFDASHGMALAPSFTLQSSNVRLSAPRLNLGDAVPAGLAGVDLDPALLSKLGASGALTIDAPGGLGVYGNATIGQIASNGAATLDRFELVGPGIFGTGNVAAQVTVNAGHIELDNSAGAATPVSGGGQGRLALDAVGSPTADGDVVVAGAVTVSGFQSGVSIQASGRQTSASQTAAGTGELRFAGNAGGSAALALTDPAVSLAIDSTRVTADRGVNASILVPGALTMTASGAPQPPETSQLGASLQVTAQSVDLAGRIDLPAGVVQISTTGTGAGDGITLASGGSIRVAGATQTFASTSADASAGSISLTSASGSIVETSGASLDLQGAGQQGDSGSLKLSAPSGSVLLQGTLKLAPGSAARGADIAIDASRLDNFSSLAQSIDAASGGTPLDSISMRGRTGDIQMSSADSLKATHIALEADGGAGPSDGSIFVGGTLDASGLAGGTVALYANNQTAIESGANIFARATGAGADGGRVTVSSRVTANLVAPTTLDAISVQGGSTIDVSGGAGGNGGTITLRANAFDPGKADADVELGPLSGSLVGARQVVVEGVTVVQQNGNVTLDGSASDPLASAAPGLQSYMSAMAANNVLGRLGGQLPVSLRPGIEIQATGDITVSSAIDFSTGLVDPVGATNTFKWRYGGGSAGAQTLAGSVPGDLTLRAGGNLLINASISDGFAPGATRGSSGPNPNVWQSGESWTYRFAAGADLQAANPGRTTGSSNDLTIGVGVSSSTTVVRTGTGSISLAASRDIVLRNTFGQQNGTGTGLTGNDVYTAGVGNVSAVSGVSFPRSGVQPVLTQWGGDVSLKAGRDIQGTDTVIDPNTGSYIDTTGSTQYVNDWLYRGGNGTAATPTAWWVNFGTFQQGVGALGGGNLDVQAGRDVIRLGAVVPSQGYAVNGQVISLDAGRLDVRAGGSIQQGLFYDEAGQARLVATSLARDTNPNDFFSDPTLSQVRLAQGSNLLDIQARASINIVPPFDPTSYTTAVGNFAGAAARFPGVYSTYFFTYGDASRLEVRSAAGDVTIGSPLSPSTGAPGLISAAFSGYTAGSYYDYGYVMPPTVDLIAFGGSVDAFVSDRYLRTYPSASGNLRVLAGQNVQELGIAMSQADSTVLPGPANPLSMVGPGAFVSTEQRPSLQSYIDSVLQSSTPLHASDPLNAEIVARSGSIVDTELSLPKAAEIVAGDSIVSLPDGNLTKFYLQNQSDGALSVISAGKRVDLSQGNTSNLGASNGGRIEINGPGAAEITSGGTIDLGVKQDNGIISNGNLRNPYLAPVGATLIVTAGAGRDAQGMALRPDYANVVRQFLLHDSFAAAGSDAGALDAQVLAAIKAAAASDPATFAPFYALLQDGLANRAAIADPTSLVSKELAALSPAALARAAIKLAASVQSVANTRFVKTQNKDTFAPGYAVFSDLFPQVADSAAAVRSFIEANPFAAASDAASLRDQALANVPQALADVIRAGIAHPDQVGVAGSAFEQALAALDPGLLLDGSRTLLAGTLQVAGSELDKLVAANRLAAGAGSPFAKELTAFANAFSPAGARGANDLSMVYSTIKAEQSGDIALFDPQGGVLVGQSATPPGVITEKAASDLGIFTLGGGSITGMVRDNFDVFRSRVFTVAGGDILLWSSQENIDAGRGPRDVAVAPAPTLVANPLTGSEQLDIGGAVTGSGIGALKTQANQAPSNIDLIAPAGYVDAGEAGIRAETGTVTLGTNLVLNAGNIQAASGVSGGAVVVAPPAPLPASSLGNQAERAVEDVERAAAAQQQEAEQRAAENRRKRVTGEFIGFGND